MADGEQALSAEERNRLEEEEAERERLREAQRAERAEPLAPPEEIPGLDYINNRHDPDEEEMHPRHYHPPTHFFEPLRDEVQPLLLPPQANIFQPARYDPEAYEDYDVEADGDGRGGVEEPDQNEQVVWIDSDDDNVTEDMILKANFGLPYSDHNYDCADPTERVIHPQEGPFPVLGPLDESGQIVTQWFPPGCEPMRPHSDESSPPMSPQTQPLQQQQLPPQQQQQHGLHHQQHMPGGRPVMQGARPMGASQPFSMGGSQIEYQRGDAINRGRGDNGPYRLISSTEYNNGMMAGRAGAGVGMRGAPAATIIRTNRGDAGAVYHQQGQPIGAVRTTQLPPHRRPIPPHQQQSSTPGSYSHIAHPTPAGGTIIRRPPTMGRPPGGPGHRPVPVLNRQQQLAMAARANEEREYHAEHHHQMQHQGQPVIAASSAPPLQRRVADVAPHRMTQEQRQEQQQLIRSRPQFSAADQGQSPARQGPGRLLVRGPGAHGVPQAGAGVLVRRGPPVVDDVNRSPQKAVEQQQQPGTDQPQARKFQVKATDSYSAPIQKASDQLPAQLTEDPPEEKPQVNEAPVLTPAAEQSVAEQNETPPADQETGETAQETSEAATPASPTKTLIKPTPPHRYTQEEKSAHFAKLSGEKINPLSPPRMSQNMQSSSSSHLPMRSGGHQEDTLAMVQSVFESKPRLADTPKDKEAISKIADHLRFSAQRYETGNTLPESSRRRNDSGMSGGHHPLQHYQPRDGIDEERRRSRYESNQQQPHPLHGSSALGRHALPPQLSQQHMQGPLDQPQRARGRPKGSTGATSSSVSAPRNRYPDGQEIPVPPHRVGGARTLPPRQAAVAAASSAPPTNRRRPRSSNSDSESEGVDHEDWVMRCHCGMGHGDGFSVECEQCKTWQHGYCMGLQPDDEASQDYQCEMCVPRKLPISKAEAIRIQKKELLKLKKATEQENKAKKSRKSEVVEQKKPQPSAARKSAPAPNSYQQQQQQHHMQQQHHQQQQHSSMSSSVHHSNEYSKAAAILLTTMERTAGADQLLEESRRMAKARRMYISEATEALVTTHEVAQRSVVLEVVGYISMARECKRMPGGGGCIFMYDGLMKGTAGEDTGDTQELICVDTRRKGNDTRYCRRSCVPNCVLKHVLGSNATLGVMVVATKDIARNQEVTLPFDLDWGEADEPLACAEHILNPEDCPFEKQRQLMAAERNAREEAERAVIEREEREEQERRRLEDEVRRERAEATRKLEAEEERERREAAKKAKEEAKKKKEAAKAEKTSKNNRQASEERSRRSGSAASNRSARASAEPQIKLTREERAAQQAEERFRKAEEEQKRREAAKAKAQAKAAAAAVAEQQKKEVKEEVKEEETSETPARASSRSRRNTTLTRQSATPSSSLQSAKRPSKRRESEMRTETPTPAAKRARTSKKESDSLNDRITDELFERGCDIAVFGVNNMDSKPMFSVFKDEEIAVVTEQKRQFREAQLEKKRLSSKRAAEAQQPAPVEEMKMEVEEPAEEPMEDEPMEEPREAQVEELLDEPMEEPVEEPKEEPVELRNVALKEEVMSKEPTPEPIVVPENQVTEVPAVVEPVEKPGLAAPEPTPAPVVTEPVAEVQAPAQAPIVEVPAAVVKPKEEPATVAPAPLVKPKEEPAPATRAQLVKPKKGPAPVAVAAAVVPSPPTVAENTTGGTKKISMADYMAIRKTRATNADESSASSTPAATRQGFIPSTEGSRNANISLMEIPLHDQLLRPTAPATAAPFIPPPPPRSAVPPPAEDEPVAHTQSLADRAALVFGIVIPSATPRRKTPPPPPPPSGPSSSHGSRSHDNRSRRNTRWN